MHVTALNKSSYLSLPFLDPIGPIDNSKITVNKNGHLTLKPGTILLFLRYSIITLLLLYRTKIVCCLESLLKCCNKHKLIKSWKKTKHFCKQNSSRFSVHHSVLYPAGVSDI